MATQNVNVTIAGQTYNVACSIGGGVPNPTGWFSVKAYGAVGDGVADDATAINAAVNAAYAAGGGTVLLGGYNYRVGATIYIKENVSLVGDGSHHSTVITKAFNGTLVDMGNTAAISNVWLACAGASYTGRGIYVSSGFSQQIQAVRIDSAEGVALEFAEDVGGGCLVSALYATTTQPTTVPAVKFTNGAVGSPKAFVGMWLSGGLIDVSGAGQSASISGFYIRNIISDADTALVYFANGRVASVSDTTTITGTGIHFTGVSFSGPVVLDGAQGCRFSACTFGTGITEDAATCQDNEYEVTGKSYSPAWGQTAGTGPTIGNGSLTGFYSRAGTMCSVSIALVLGSTSTHGDTSGGWTITLPFRGDNARDQRGLAVKVTIGSTNYTVWGTIGANSNLLVMDYNGQSVRGAYPTTWSANDRIDVAVTYSAN